VVTLPLRCRSVRLGENGIDFMLLQITYWALNTAPTRDLPHLSCLRNRRGIAPRSEIKQGAQTSQPTVTCSSGNAMGALVMLEKCEHVVGRNVA
jgi:hypothetical protein